MVVEVSWFGEHFLFFGTSKLEIIRGRQNTNAYLDVMNSVLLPYADENMPLRWTYQQDNAPIHVSKTAREWFSRNSVRLMDWLSRSPDFNPIENVWGWLARRVYDNNRQFASVRDFTNCVFEEWNQMPRSLLEKLLNTMNDRCIEVLQKNGGPTHY